MVYILQLKYSCSLILRAEVVYGKCCSLPWVWHMFLEKACDGLCGLSTFNGFGWNTIKGFNRACGPLSDTLQAGAWIFPRYRKWPDHMGRFCPIENAVIMWYKIILYTCIIRSTVSASPCYWEQKICVPLDNLKHMFPLPSLLEKPFFCFVGEKCCDTTILDPQQLKTVGVGLTFQPFVGATFTSFVGPTIFVNKREKVTPTPTVLTVGEPKNVWPNSFPPTKVLKVCCCK